MLWRLFHKSRIDEYRKRDEPCWAIVTGATDGIGKCLAEELLNHGFNVIIHGRTPSKVARVVEEFKALYPERQIDSVLADLSRLEDVPNIVSAISQKNVTVFINNAGATDRAFVLFDEMPKSEVERTLTVGVMFITRLIHETLPILEKNVPSVMVNIGSQSCEVPVPYVSLYAASKGFLRSLTRCISAEARYKKTGVEIIYADIHNVQSAGNHLDVSLIVPTSRRAAQAIIDIIGCNYGVVTPYWMHEFSRYFSAYLLPEWLLEKLSVASMLSVIEADKAYRERLAESG